MWWQSRRSSRTRARRPRGAPARGGLAGTAGGDRVLAACGLAPCAERAIAPAAPRRLRRRPSLPLPPWPLAGGDARRRRGRGPLAPFGCPSAETDRPVRATEMTSSRKLSPRRGVVCRVFGSLAETDREVVDAIPCASVPLTLLGLAATAPATLPGALARAERRGRLDLSAIAELLARRPRTPGGPALRRALRAYRVEWEWTRGELERRALALFGAAGCRGRTSTLGSQFRGTAARSISAGPRCDWPSRQTGGRHTAIGAHSRRTAGATRPSWPPAGAC